MKAQANAGPLANLPAWLAPAVLSAAISVAGAFLGVQRGQALTDQRLTAAEQEIDANKAERVADFGELKQKIVPRAEHEAHWKADQDFRALLLKRLEEIGQDVRELRNRNTSR